MTLAPRPIDVLIVDDDLGDVLLIQDALEQKANARSAHVANGGDEALAFLRREGEHAGAPRPDVILLDLNMPGKNGRQVLAEIKADPALASIPVLIFTTSQDPNDILASYSLHANAHITKPINLDDFAAVIDQIHDFYTQVATLPSLR